MMRQSLLRAPKTIVRGANGVQAGGYGFTARAAGGYGSVVEGRRQAHAISNPTLANIEKRWEAMPPQEQADLWMALRDRMKVNWGELTLQEKKAGKNSDPCSML
jgi:cytochrome c oxidase subunit 4